MAERQQRHNIEMERRITDAAIADEHRGMWIGAGILVIVLAGAFAAGVFYNNDVLAGLLLAAAVVDVIGMFVHRERSHTAVEQPKDPKS